MSVHGYIPMAELRKQLAILRAATASLGAFVDGRSEEDPGLAFLVDGPNNLRSSAKSIASISGRLTTAAAALEMVTLDEETLSRVLESGDFTRKDDQQSPALSARKRASGRKKTP